MLYWGFKKINLVANFLFLFWDLISNLAMLFVILYYLVFLIMQTHFFFRNHFLSFLMKEFTSQYS